MKFKIWDKKNKYFREEPYYRWMIASNGHLYNSENDEWYTDSKKFEVLWSSGKIDKKDTEIYEGDIVLNESDSSKRVIEYCEDTCCFIARHLPNEKYCEPLWMHDGEFEIVGNMYEV